MDNPTPAPAAPAAKIDLAPLVADMETKAAVFADASKNEAQAYTRAVQGDQLERIAHFQALGALSTAHADCVAAEKAYLDAKEQNGK